MPRKRRESGKKKDPAKAAYLAGLKQVQSHPVFAPMMMRVWIEREARRSVCPADGVAVVTHLGHIHVHPTKRLQPGQWAFALAHCLLHLGMDHFHRRDRPELWNTACDAFVTQFLRSLKFGEPLTRFAPDWRVPAQDEQSLYEQLLRDGLHADAVLGVRATLCERGECRRTHPPGRADGAQ